MTTASHAKSQSRIGLILLAFIAFISLGLPDGLLGVAWPSVRREFEMPLDAIGFMLFAGMFGYLSSSFFSGKIVSRLGVGKLLAVSCFLTGGALVGYTLAPSYWVIVGLSLFSGLGAGAIDAGLNTYIAANHGEGLMQWLHASFGVGITLGPIIMTTAVNGFGQWRLGYLVVGIAQITLALCFFLSAAMWQQDAAPAEAETSKLTDYKTSLRETIRQRGAWMSVLLFFIYTGIELAFGHWSYTLLTESRGVAPETAGLVAGSYWGMFTVGRILAGLYAKRVSAHQILQFSMFSALAGGLLVVWNPSQTVSLIGIAIVGFSVAPIFPALVSTTRNRVAHKHVANTIGIQISAAGFGGTVMPTIAGILGRRISLEAIPVFLVVLIIVLIAVYTYGSRPKAE
jgi:fucose permease